jgi:putative glutamine amidotransferase
MGIAGAGTPCIGVSWLAANEGATHLCVLAVKAAGGEPVPLPAHASSWAREIDRIEGLILTGGNAVDPRRYGEENRGLCRVVIPQRDELEMEALERCRERGLPVLGICRGMQFLNVALGGAMHQHLPTAVTHEADGETPRFHPVQVLPNSRLATVTAVRGRLRVNSLHHQGLEAVHLAPGLRINALAPDGVVEGIEAPGEPLLMGIQFHPERPGEVPEMVGIFKELVRRARE